MLVDIKINGSLDQSDHPFKFGGSFFKSNYQLDRVRVVSLPRKVQKTTARINRDAEIPGLDSFMEKAKSIEYGTLPGCVGADEKVKVAKIDACVVKTAIIFRRKSQELHLLT